MRSRGLLSDLVPQPYFLSELLAREPQELIWSEAAAKLRQVKGMLPRRAEAEGVVRFFVWTVKNRGKLHPRKLTAACPKWMGFGRGNYLSKRKFRVSMLEFLGCNCIQSS